MKMLKAFVAFLTLSAFMTSGMPTGQWILVQDADAQTTSSAGTSTTVPNYAPATMPMLALATNSVSQQVSACDAKALLLDPTSALKAAPTPSSKKDGKGKNAAATCPTSIQGDTPNYDGKFTCDMKCAAPVTLSDLSKGAFCSTKTHNGAKAADESSDVTTISSFKDGKEADLNKDKADVNKYLAFLAFENDQCASNDIKAVQAQISVYQCKMQALASAEGMAANQLQMALNQNNQNFTKMTQFQNQVKDQMSQVDEILGPDKSDPNSGANAQFGGLLGVQKSLQDNIGKWNSNKSTFKTRYDTIQQRITQNQQSLKSQETAQVTDCLKGNSNMAGSGGSSLQCYKPASTTTTDSTGKSTSTPVTDAAGNAKYTKQACGPLEYVRSQVTQAPFRGGLKSASRNDQSQSFGADYDALVNAMLRDAGAYDTATDAGALVTRGTDWNSIMTKYAGQMQSISNESGINIAAQLQQASQTCTSQGTSWYNQQINSASSQYNLTLNGDPAKGTAGINGDKRTLNTDVQTANTEVTQGVSQAQALMGGGPPASCTSSDLATEINSCYTKLAQQATDDLNGTGTAGITTKPITGGSLLPSFSVSCRGINNCVTTYQAIRSAKKTQLTTAAKASEDFVNQGNSTIQNQLQAFAGNLSGLQQQVSASFNSISDKLASLGMTSTAKQKQIPGEALETTGGKDGGPAGPYQNPKSMAAVLSGMVQPNGLLDFGDDGTKDLMADVQEQTKAKQEKISKDVDTYQSALSKITSIDEDCNTGKSGDDDGSGRVASSTDINTCLQVKSACAYGGDGGFPGDGSADDTFAEVSEGMAASTQDDAMASIQAAFASMKDISGSCSKTRSACYRVANTKALNTTSQNAGDGSNTAGAATTAPAPK